MQFLQWTTWPVVMLQMCGCGALESPACAAMQALSITEMMPNPLGVDAGQEWIEIYNGSWAPVPLDGIQLRVGATHAKKHRFHTGFSVPAKGYGVLGPPAQALAQVNYGNLIELPNREAIVGLYCDEGSLEEPMVQVRYGPQEAVPAPEEGHSLVLGAESVPNALSPQSASWCIASGAAYDGRNIGTPGLQNPTCAATCRDGTLWRVAQPPAVRIGEVLADPVGADANREWVRLVVDGPGDLAALRLAFSGSRSRQWHLDETSCAAVVAGDLPMVALVQERAAFLDAGVPELAPWAWAVGPGTLPNGGGVLQLWAGAVLLDSVQLPPARRGTPWSREAAGP